MNAFLILTAITVSIDSFVCGFSLSTTGGKKFTIVTGITLTVFIMCLITNYSAVFLSKFLTEKTASFGGLILIGIGIYNLVKNDGENITSNGIVKQSLLSGFAVGLDGALANLSLSLMGLNAFYVPLTIALFHAVAVSLGILLSKTKIIKNYCKLNFLPPLILIALGIYKTAGLFL